MVLQVFGLFFDVGCSSSWSMILSLFYHLNASNQNGIYMIISTVVPKKLEDKCTSGVMRYDFV